MLEGKDFINNRPTRKMVIPKLSEDQIIFGLQNKPGVFFVGTYAHLNLEKINEHDPYEMSWEQAIVALNGNDWFGGKPKLEYCDDLPRSITAELEAVCIDIDVSDL